MATARATQRWADCSLSVSVEVENSYPQCVAEATTRCRELLRDVVADWNAQIVEAEAEG